MLIFKQLKEGLKFSVHALLNNNLRTLLSLLGITIGIFAIILVYSVVDSLEKNIRESVNALGDNVIYVQKWPFGGNSDYPWWKYLNRPEPSLSDANELAKRCSSAEVVAFSFSTSATAKYKSNVVENASLTGAQHGIEKVWSYTLSAGRDFTDFENRNGKSFAIIGQDVAEGLFGSADPIGRRFKIKGTKVTVIGVFTKTGQSLIGQNFDQMVLVPARFLSQLQNPTFSNGNKIMVKARPGVSLQELKDDVQSNLRAIHRLNPRSEDDFSMNETSMLTQSLDSFFKVMSIAGTIIGGFSILVGGFGIANIMFVSVKERTGEIGIQKALGARNSFILVQFLSESILLCLIGGAMGLILVYFGAMAAAKAFDFNIYLSLGNTILGVVLSFVIGLISGFLPAYSASRMEPVDAIRFKQ
jgi:putative ABC transport system permease protein